MTSGILRPQFKRGKLAQAARDVLAALFFLVFCGVVAAAIGCPVAVALLFF
jgi:hypothetical protein